MLGLLKLKWQPESAILLTSNSWTTGESSLQWISHYETRGLAWEVRNTRCERTTFLLVQVSSRVPGDLVRTYTGPRLSLLRDHRLSVRLAEILVCLVAGAPAHATPHWKNCKQSLSSKVFNAFRIK